jgi:4-amino-4-deoxy-L-arabinose transferase-like glycosyltransferase
MTGDEALFYVWSLFPQMGYYDHPPMIAWWIYFMRHLSDTALFVRMPAVILNHGIVLGLMALLRSYKVDDSRAYLVGSIYLLLPVSVLGVLITTDTPLIAFSFMATYFFIKGIQEEYSGKFIQPSFMCVGIFLGLAFLSKYFAVLLGFAFIAILIFRRQWNRLIWVVLCVTPFGLVNLFWNLNHCWQNIMFNLVNRHQDYSGNPLTNVAVYLLLIIYVLTPWVIWRIFRSRERLRDTSNLVLLAVIPFVLFMLLAFKKQIGLHWLIGFVPVVFLLLGMALSQDVLVRLKRWTLWLLAPHLALICFLIVMPASIWSSYGFYKNLSTLKNLEEISLVAKQQLSGDDVLMTEGYSMASVMSFYLKQHVPVFGMGSKYARFDDLNFDYRNLNGKTLYILRTKPPELDMYSAYGRISQSQFDISGITYWLVKVDQFNFPNYQRTVLKEIKEKYYQFPAFLPACRCDFIDKYDLAKELK